MTWPAVLDRLEADVVAAESLARQARAGGAPGEQAQRTDDAVLLAAPVPWQPPVGLDALPAALEGRARELLARQEAAARDLAEAARGVRRQLVATDGLSGPDPAERPVFLDVEG
ncbi:hypothetical protein [Xylanimonas oleitrophica]|nr:hypothetical protein [Xylanimonas oleitrophica]